MERLQQMAVFAAVVDSGSFTEAARRLGVAKSTASKRVAELEARLGARLLNRTTRRLSLTDAGQAFYERCARMVAEAEEAEEAVGRLQNEPRGTLRVSAPLSYGVDYLAPRLPEFLAAHPAVTLALSFDDRFVDLVAEGFDVAVRVTGRMADSTLVARKLAETRLLVCAAPDYLARRGTPDAPEELAGHACLRYAHAAGGEPWRLSGPAGEQTVRVAGPLIANNGGALVAAAVGGLGIVLLPDFIVEPALAEGRLVQIMPDWHGEGAAVWAVYPPSPHVPAKVRVFLDFLAARVAPGAPQA